MSIHNEYSRENSTTQLIHMDSEASTFASSPTSTNPNLSTIAEETDCVETTEKDLMNSSSEQDEDSDVEASTAL